MADIKIECDNCGTILTVKRTLEIPDNVKSLGCNWCPLCEGDQDEVYVEWHNEFYVDEKEIDDPNQTEINF